MTDMNGLTREAFARQRKELGCQHCGQVGLDEYRPSSGADLVGARCPGCGSLRPLAGVQWLPKDSATRRRPRSAISPEDVWMANGDHCAFCGKSRTLCLRLGVGLTVQHVVPVVFGGEDSVLIPFCARCQEASVAALRETRNILGELESLDAIIKRIEAAHPELRG